MSQSQFNLTVADQAAAGTVVVTHGDDFDEAAFKTAIGI